jgi:hypothetical protein
VRQQAIYGGGRLPRRLGCPHLRTLGFQPVARFILQQQLARFQRATATQAERLR